MDIVYRVCEFLQKIAFRLFSDYKVAGVENVPPMGPLIVVCNHQSNMDPSILAAALPRRIWFLAKEGIFRVFIARWFLRAWGAFPLRRGETDLRAYRWSLEKLRSDQVLVVFPEGTRSTGGMRRARIGIAQIALTTQATILPVGMTGTERHGSCFKVFYPSGRLRVNIGMPFSLPVVEGKPSKEVLQSLTDMIMNRVAMLLPEEYRGAYATPRAGSAAAGHERAVAGGAVTYANDNGPAQSTPGG